MSTTRNDPAGDFCWCEDADLDRLRDLMAAGIEQVPASLMLWGNAGDEPTALSNMLAWAQLAMLRRPPWYRPTLGEAGR